MRSSDLLPCAASFLTRPAVFSFVSRSRTLGICVVLSLGACGGIAETTPSDGDSDARLADEDTHSGAGDEDHDGMNPGDSTMQSPNVVPSVPPEPESTCDCPDGNYGITLEGPDGFVFYDLPAKEQTSGCELPQAIPSDCTARIFSACHATEGCIYLIQGPNESSIELLNDQATSIRIVKDDSKAITLSREEGIAYGEFKLDLDERGVPRYRGTFSLCENAKAGGPTLPCIK